MLSWWSVAYCGCLRLTIVYSYSNSFFLSFFLSFFSSSSFFFSSSHLLEQPLAWHHINVEMHVHTCMNAEVRKTPPFRSSRVCWCARDIDDLSATIEQFSSSKKKVRKRSDVCTVSMLVQVECYYYLLRALDLLQLLSSRIDRRALQCNWCGQLRYHATELYSGQTTWRQISVWTQA